MTNKTLTIEDLVDSILAYSDGDDERRNEHLKASILEMVDSAAMRNVCADVDDEWGDHVYFDGGDLIGAKICGKEIADTLNGEWQRLWDALPENARKIAE